VGLYIVTRPSTDAAALGERLTAMGHAAIAAPLMDIRFLDQADIPVLAFQAVLVTSANGARALARHAALPRLRQATAIAVGEASGAAARAAGFARVVVADGDVAALIATVKTSLRPGNGPLLYASGRQTTGDVAGELGQAGFALHRAVLYEAVAATALPPAVREAVARGKADGVLLYSPRSARIWCRLALAAGLADGFGALVHYCLSANVKKALAETGCGEVMMQVAPRPEEAALLRLIAEAGG
jgi:uroporphyrinogen-III synthase